LNGLKLRPRRPRLFQGPSKLFHGPSNRSHGASPPQGPPPLFHEPPLFHGPPPLFHGPSKRSHGASPPHGPPPLFHEPPLFHGPPPLFHGPSKRSHGALPPHGPPPYASAGCDSDSKLLQTRTDIAIDRIFMIVPPLAKTYLNQNIEIVQEKQQRKFFSGFRCQEIIHQNAVRDKGIGSRSSCIESSDRYRSSAPIPSCIIERELRQVAKALYIAPSRRNIQ